MTHQPWVGKSNPAFWRCFFLLEKPWHNSWLETYPPFNWWTRVLSWPSVFHGEINDQLISSEFLQQAPNTTLADIPFAMVFGSKWVDQCPFHALFHIQSNLVIFTKEFQLRKFFMESSCDNHENIPLQKPSTLQKGQCLKNWMFQAFSLH